MLGGRHLFFLTVKVGYDVYMDKIIYKYLIKGSFDNLNELKLKVKC